MVSQVCGERRPESVCVACSCAQVYTAARVFIRQRLGCQLGCSRMGVPFPLPSKVQLSSFAWAYVSRFCLPATPRPYFTQRQDILPMNQPVSTQAECWTTLRPYIVHWAAIMYAVDPLRRTLCRHYPCFTSDEYSAHVQSHRTMRKTAGSFRDISQSRQLALGNGPPRSVG